MQISLYNEKVTKATPFLKWVGGKRQLIPEIENIFPSELKKNRIIKKYFEPFVGGGALLFYLKSNYKVKNAYISDINKELILTYIVIQKDPETLISYLKNLEHDYKKLNQKERKDYYLDVRSKFNSDLTSFDYNIFDDMTIQRASYTLFMNRTCFNGLFRLNKKGEFNVPHGRYKNPKICDAENIRNVHDILKNVEIKNTSYLYSEELIDKDSLVYLDPPYRPISETSNFTSYSDNDFDDNDQIELSKYYKRISQKGAYAILSNSDPHNGNINDNFFDELYQDFEIMRINAKRNINSKGDKRGPITELLIKNY